MLKMSKFAKLSHYTELRVVVVALKYKYILYLEILKVGNLSTQVAKVNLKGFTVPL